MNKGYQSFLEHTESKLSQNNSFTNPCFNTYQFSSELGKGYTSIYELDSYASICIAEHSYFCDFEYAVISDDSISIQQYDSIDSDHCYPKGDVYSGMQYIDYTPDDEVYRYVIKKDIPAKLIGIQLMPEYYDVYLKKEFGVNSVNLKEDLKVFPHGISIPEISSVFNQIRNFKGNEYCSKLFFKSKIDELTAIIIQKADMFQNLNASVSIADRNAIIEITAYLNQNLSKKFSLIELSADACMSISKFKYVFKNVVGQSLSEYITQKRMEHACEMLSYSNLYIAEIAHLIGYKNAGSFSSQFKKYMGVLPIDYRLNRVDVHVNSD
ncbi:AraC family transcriptional regulator [Peptostreptococcus stomatis]|uniref:AraC family transcriptional regulator n=1 Tax=Peptostreptococcus stomatis TaxID=341694 RepID=UPI001A3CFE54|nr:AraC family transcriptional regulator [Peptostreptococcus stomatis]MBL6466454.1 helix-turn-helix transcriptional regulator [Peptostreptococcus stomatis]